MAFTPSTLSVMVQTIGGVGMRFMSYRSDDPLATLTGTNYFARGTDYGLRPYDLIFVSPVSGTVEPYILVGTAVDSEGNVTATQTIFDEDLTALVGLDTADGNFIVGNGTTWAAESGATARASLGLAIGTDVQAYSANLDEYAAVNPTAAGLALLDDADASAQRTTLGLAIGTDVQAHDADLTAIGALAKTDGNFIVGNGTTWVAESGATVRASLGLTIGTDVQAYDADLTAIAAFSTTGFAVRTASNTWAQRSIAGTSGKITVTNGDGVSGNPTITVGADIAQLTVADQVITGGARVTSLSLGTITSGTVTPDPGDRPLQHYTNGGAHTLAPGSNTGYYLLDITNNGSAGAITTSGWTKVSGDSFTTTNGHKFRCSCSIGEAGSSLSILKMQ